MTDLTLSKPITLDDLLQSDRDIEIIDGEPSEVAGGGATHQFAGENIRDAIKPVVDAGNLGLVFAEGYTASRDFFQEIQR